MIQLNPPLPVTTPKGKGIAHFVTDYSIEHHLYWTVFLDNGEIWTFSNTEVRADSNETWGRKENAKNKLDKDLLCPRTDKWITWYTPEYNADFCTCCNYPKEMHLVSTAADKFKWNGNSWEDR